MISVKIIKCSSPDYWYADKIGRVLDFKTKDENYVPFRIMFDENYLIKIGDFIYVDRRKKIEKLIKKIDEQRRIN